MPSRASETATACRGCASGGGVASAPEKPVTCGLAGPRELESGGNELRSPCPNQQRRGAPQTHEIALSVCHCAQGGTTWSPGGAGQRQPASGAQRAGASAGGRASESVSGGAEALLGVARQTKPAIGVPRAGVNVTSRGPIGSSGSQERRRRRPDESTPAQRAAGRRFRK